MRGRATRALIVVAAVSGSLLGSCSLGGDEEARPARGPARQVAAVVDRLERATRARSYGTICDEVFSAQARERAGGADCPRLLRESAGDVRRPRLELQAIEFEKDRATARVRTRASGQAAVYETIVLVRERGGYRVSGLSD